MYKFNTILCTFCQVMDLQSYNLPDYIQFFFTVILKVRLVSFYILPTVNKSHEKGSNVCVSLSLNTNFPSLSVALSPNSIPS